MKIRDEENFCIFGVQIHGPGPNLGEYHKRYDNKAAAVKDYPHVQLLLGCSVCRVYHGYQGKLDWPRLHKKVKGPSKQDAIRLKEC
jgi:hypothetical protein